MLVKDEKFCLHSESYLLSKDLSRFRDFTDFHPIEWSRTDDRYFHRSRQR